MRLLILGTNEHAISLASACKTIATSITFFDKDTVSLDNLKEDIENNLDKRSGLRKKLNFCSTLSLDTNHSVIVFDFLKDNEEKLDIIKEINREIPSGSLIFTTSKIYSVSKIASLSSDPKSIIGLQYLHLFEKTKVVELVRGIHTSQKVLEKAQWVMTELGKETTKVKDSPGFLLNRMTLVLINEAIHLLNEAVASPSEIDKELELALGLEYGPLRLADNMGLDTVLKMLNSIYEGTGNPKFLPCSLLQNMVYSGYLGKKSNSGFYSYSAEILNFPHLKVF